MPSHIFRALALAVAAAAVFSVTALTRADVDLWGHLRFGLDILESRTLESADPYSFTSDRPWINHEWLSEISIAGAWLAGGATGLILVKLACILGALAFMAAALAEQGIGGRARIMLLGLTLVGLLTRVTHVRPQLFSVLLFSALIYIFVRSERRSARTLLWTIPILVLWANFHGGWMVGLGTVTVWCLGMTVVSRQSSVVSRSSVVSQSSGVAEWLWPIAIAGAAALSTLVNPYGSGLWAFLLETVRFGREAISEWGPAWNSWTTLGVWMCFAALTVVGLRRCSGLGTRLARRSAGEGGGPGFEIAQLTERNPAALALPIFWGLAALRVNRLDTFFAMSVMGLMAPALATMFQRRESGAPLPLAWKAGGLALAALMVISVPATRKTLTCIGIHATWPEPDAVDFMRERQMTGRIVTYFDWGEYAIWNLPPDLKVSMDGRRETVYSDRTVDGHLQLYRGTERGLAYLDELHADYVWFPRQLPVVNTLQQRGWRMIYQGSNSVLMANGASADAVTSSPVTGSLPGPRCFPGP